MDYDWRFEKELQEDSQSWKPKWANKFARGPFNIRDLHTRSNERFKLPDVERQSSYRKFFFPRTRKFLY